MEQVVNALYMTIELWIFVGILGMALVAEEVYKFMQRRNDAHQLRIDLEIDRLHK